MLVASHKPYIQASPHGHVDPPPSNSVVRPCKRSVDSKEEGSCKRQRTSQPHEEPRTISSTQFVPATGRSTTAAASSAASSTRQQLPLRPEQVASSSRVPSRSKKDRQAPDDIPDPLSPAPPSQVSVYALPAFPEPPAIPDNTCVCTSGLPCPREVTTQSHLLSIDPDTIVTDPTCVLPLRIRRKFLASDIRLI